jgi:ATP/maltotriose-dependent transcriptional regulator MalT
LRLLAAAHGDHGAIDEAAELGHAAQRLARELGERTIEAEALSTLGVIAHHTDRHRDAAAHHERGLELVRATGDRCPETEALIGLAEEHDCLGDRQQALHHARQALAIAREADYGLLEERTRAVLEIDRSRSAPDPC